MLSRQWLSSREIYFKGERSDTYSVLLSILIESAVAQHCRTVYLNAGHDIQTVQDVKNSLLFMRGVKNSKVSVIEIESSQNELETQSIENISH